MQMAEFDINSTLINRTPWEDRLLQTRGIIWDLDNTLYRLNEALSHSFNHAIARAVREAGIDKPLEEIVVLAEKSFAAYGYSGRVFVQEFGIDREYLHYTAHGYIDQTVIEASRHTVELFEKLPVEHMLITHGSKLWARRVLEHIGLQRWFPEERMLAYEDYNFESKAESPLSFRRALEALSLPASDVVFVEDTMRNLRVPHALGMGTVLLHHGQEPEKAEAFVDHLCNNANDLLEALYARILSANLPPVR
jgi:putative hydrolase of the HAD superfamily